MKIAVCINHVPDTETKIKVGPDSLSIDRTGVNYMMSPYDEIALEEGLRIREKFKGEVIAISLGADQHRETLRKALAMGADKAMWEEDFNYRIGETIYTTDSHKCPNPEKATPVMKERARSSRSPCPC